MVWLLFTDNRINIFLKTLPVLAFTYLISPIDALAVPIIGVLDDAAIVWIGSALFVGLCPPEIVEEHMSSLKNIIDTTWNNAPEEEVVDAEARDISDHLES